MKSLGAFTAAEMTSGSSQVVKLFNNTVMDISGTLLEKGYSRKLEKAADLAAVDLMKTSGYNPDALLSMLQKIVGSETKKTKAFSAHPPAKDRCEYVGREVGKAAGPASPARAARYHTARQLSGI
jgi:predicted Zn-dependent protease